MQLYFNNIMDEIVNFNIANSKNGRRSLFGIIYSKISNLIQLIIRKNNIKKLINNSDEIP